MRGKRISDMRYEHFWNKKRFKDEMKEYRMKYNQL